MGVMPRGNTEPSLARENRTRGKYVKGNRSLRTKGDVRARVCVVLSREKAGRYETWTDPGDGELESGQSGGRTKWRQDKVEAGQSGGRTKWSQEKVETGKSGDRVKFRQDVSREDKVVR